MNDNARGVRIDKWLWAARFFKTRSLAQTAVSGGKVRLKDERVKVAKLDVDQNQATSMKYGIRGIPTLMLFKDGKLAATKVGALSKSQMAAFIDENLKEQA